MIELADWEQRAEHTYRLSHVLVFGHGLADTTDADLAAAMAKAELERLGVL